MSTRVLDKDEYRQFCKEDNNTPIFFKDWWLDIVCGKNRWDIICIKIAGHTTILLPYSIEKRLFFTVSRMPPYTPYLGPLINSTHEFKLTKEYLYHEKLIERLPQFDFFLQKWPISNTSWFPYYRNGFNQFSSYTYLLNDIKDHVNTFNKFSSDTRKVIEKNINHVTLRINKLDENLIQFQKQIYERQEILSPFNSELIYNLVKEAIRRDKGVLIGCYNEEGKEIANSFIVFDKDIAYYLLQGVHKDYYNKGLAQIVIWESIKLASKRCDQFNFEGSMIPQVEKVFRKFGGVQQPYNVIYKDGSKLISILRILWNKFRIR